jgi:hypothetical protein
VGAEDSVAFLKENAQSEEVVIDATGPSQNPFANSVSSGGFEAVWSFFIIRGDTVPTAEDTDNDKKQQATYGRDLIAT